MRLTSVLSSDQKRLPMFMEKWLTEGTTRISLPGVSFPCSSSRASLRTSWEATYICCTSLPRNAPTMQAAFSPSPKRKPVTRRSSR